MAQDTKRQQVERLLADRQRAYKFAFKAETPEGKGVLEDLGRFCRHRESTFHPDARVHAALEGRREVMLRIEDFLTLSLDELCNKYGKGN